MVHRWIGYRFVAHFHKATAAASDGGEQIGIVACHQAHHNAGLGEPEKIAEAVAIDVSREPCGIGGGATAGDTQAVEG